LSFSLMFEGHGVVYLSIHQQWSFNAGAYWKSLQ
jgi:hypothetical protein